MKIPIEGVREQETLIVFDSKSALIETLKTLSPDQVVLIGYVEDNDVKRFDPQFDANGNLKTISPALSSYSQEVEACLGEEEREDYGESDFRPFIIRNELKNEQRTALKELNKKYGI